MNKLAMGNSKRREFLKKSVLGITGATLLQGNVRSAGSADISQEKITELPSRVLGRTGIRAPLISLGAGSAYDPNFVRAAYDAGIKLFFSATYYGEGNNEKMVGEGLKGLPRDSSLWEQRFRLTGLTIDRGFSVPVLIRMPTSGKRKHALPGSALIMLTSFYSRLPGNANR